MKLCLQQPRPVDSVWIVYGDLFGPVDGPVVAILNGRWRIPLRENGNAYEGVSEPIAADLRPAVQIEINGTVVASVKGR